MKYKSNDILNSFYSFELLVSKTKQLKYLILDLCRLNQKWLTWKFLNFSIKNELFDKIWNVSIKNDSVEKFCYFLPEIIFLKTLKVFNQKWIIWKKLKLFNQKWLTWKIWNFESKMNHLKKIKIFFNQKRLS